jgi:serine/threonine protein kinase
MNFGDLIGQIIDGKYRIERQLGRGGMGTVYLATHVGTERPVAVKIIAPQFMKRAEFVERFRREARAAGRLRHPNVVDVTDFGIAENEDGQTAYLVMEYLDGCTLGEILEEEKKLPLSWSLDILEQVCSAVHEAHKQGIIHRDLKPENIWLEPNQRGGYTVKVLDFGIAKLEEQRNTGSESDSYLSDSSTDNFNFTETVRHSENAGTIRNKQGLTSLSSEAGTAILASEAGTIIQTDETLHEKNTAIIPSDEVDLDSGTAFLSGERTQNTDEKKKSGTVLFVQDTDRNSTEKPATKDLTRVGAVLGTPLYMSPEQCSGEKLSPRSDIYSLGVIAYQMLSGKPPFEGDFTAVMQAHKNDLPPPLNVRQVPHKIKKIILSALAKNPEERPPTAEAFATQLRAQSEGFWFLLRRSLVIYSEHLPKFLGLTTLLTTPIIFLTFVSIILSFLKVSEIISEGWANIFIGVVGALLGIASIFCAYLIWGTGTWIVAQYLAVPLRPIRLRPAFWAAKQKWKKFAGTGIVSSVLTAVFGVITCGIGFLVTSVLWTLAAPVVMMENLGGWKALKRSAQLVRRSLLTTIAAVLFMFLVPACISGFISFFVNVTAEAFENQNNVRKSIERIKADVTQPSSDKTDDNPNIEIDFGNKKFPRLKNQDMSSRVKHTILESLIQIFWLPTHIFVTSFFSILVGLLYLKTRQSGGESMQELLGQFEDEKSPKPKWQQRIRERLIQSGKIVSKS